MSGGKLFASAMNAIKPVGRGNWHHWSDKTDAKENTVSLVQNSPPKKNVNCVSTFLITEVYGVNNFAVQAQEDLETVKMIESDLATLYGSGENKNTQLTYEKFFENKLCAFYCFDYQRWVRALIIDVVEGFDENMLKVKVRLLDYGIAIEVFVDFREASTSERFHKLPYRLLSLPPQGKIASQFCCPLVNEIVKVENLQKTKGFLVLAYVEFILFSNLDVPRVSLALLESMEPPAPYSPPSTVSVDT